MIASWCRNSYTPSAASSNNQRKYS